MTPQPMPQHKVDELKSRFRDNPQASQAIDRMLMNATTKEQQAIEMGLAYKAKSSTSGGGDAATELKKDDETIMDDAKDETAAAVTAPVTGQKPPKAKASAMATETKADGAVAAPPIDPGNPDDGENPMIGSLGDDTSSSGGLGEDDEDPEGFDVEGTAGDYVSDMLQGQLHDMLDKLIAQATTNALQPLMETLQAGMGQSTKETGVLAQALKEVAVTIKSVWDKQAGSDKLLAEAKKEVDGAKARIAALETAIKELKGETPRAFAGIAGGYRATEAQATVVGHVGQGQAAKQHNMPAPDPNVAALNRLIAPLVGGQALAAPDPVILLPEGNS